MTLKQSLQSLRIYLRCTLCGLIYETTEDGYNLNYFRGPAICPACRRT